MKINKDFTYIILGISVFTSFFVYISVISLIDFEQLQIIRLTQIYALISFLFIYLAMLIKPLSILRNNTSDLLRSRPALIQSAFLFGTLHGAIAFFGQLGGFGGLGYLGNTYLIAISLSLTGLVLLMLLSATSVKYVEPVLNQVVKKIFGWIVYAAGILVLIHAFMLGTHFEDITRYVPQIVFAGVAFLLFIEAIQIDKKILSSKLDFPKYNYASVFVLSLTLTAALYFYLPVPQNDGVSFGIHARHIQLAKEANNITGGGGTAVIPGLEGDRTKRYTVSFNRPENVIPGQDIELNFQVYDASNGNKVRLFNRLNEKQAHLIIVDSELEFFDHIHPEQNGNEFSITTRLPHEGRYHMYIDFQPFGAMEQQMAFTLDVGELDDPGLTTELPDSDKSKTFGDYEVSLTHPDTLIARKLSVGEQNLTYKITNADTKEPVTNLKPYLAAFGHVVMINTETFDYLHVHPADVSVPRPDEDGGPVVEFMPIGLYGPIKPGTYRVFAQFNPDNSLFTSVFTVEVR